MSVSVCSSCGRSIGTGDFVASTTDPLRTFCEDCWERSRTLPMLDDPMVREMADRNHVPTEQWTMAGTVFSVRCDECGHEWPCPTRRALAGLSGETTTRTVKS